MGWMRVLHAWSVLVRHGRESFVTKVLWWDGIQIEFLDDDG